ncbi:MAG: protein kinase [bacterium]|nr:protein kinase [bacterium]
MTDSADDMLASGRSLDSRFTLLRPLGKGGMGEVWLVRDEDLREELVAKIVPRDALGDRLALLQRECRHARRLMHPNIVKVFDFHRGDEHGFVTMDHVEGEPLGTLRGRPPVQVLDAVAQITGALAYAHDQGVVHRDLKAANVILDGEGQAHLLDFGIAGLSQGDELSVPEDDAVTGGGSRFSVSPQQLDGQPADPSDDVYALGVLIYELLTGRPPFWPEITDDDIRSAEPAPMVSNHPVPPRLASLVAAMLQKNPAERPEDMRSVARELEAIRGELPAATTEPRATAPPRLIPPPRTDRDRRSDKQTATIQPEAPRPTSGRPDAFEPRSRWPLWITAAVFGALAVTAGAVFLELPDWVRSRQAAAPTVAAMPTEAPNPPDRATDEVQPELETFEPVPTDTVEQAEARAPAPTARPTPTRSEAPPRKPERRQIGDFERAMSEGLAALDRGDYATAREAFSRAGALRPGAPQSADGLARAETGLRVATIARLREQARAFEAQEDWPQAVARYEEVLGLDPTVEFALAGHDRGHDRADLSTSLDFHLANPARLSSEEVLRAASASLAEASAIEPAGPLLQRQIGELTPLVDAYSKTVTATFESDNLTEVVIYRVGRLGTFDRRALDLRPGTYTVVGSRHGYRDVRRQLVIQPGVEPEPLTVRCQESI